MARTLDQIIAELDPAFTPQVNEYSNMINKVPNQVATRRQGLEQAKENAFNDITTQANRRGMFYSGMPIKEQARYTGEKFLPGLKEIDDWGEDLKSKYNLAIAELRGQQRLRALEMLEQEKAREEAQRAAARASSGGGGFGGFGIGGGGGGGARSSAGGGRPQLPTNVNDWITFINRMRQSAGGDKGWGETFGYMQRVLPGFQAPTGSAADQAFHAIFNRNSSNRGTGMLYNYYGR